MATVAVLGSGIVGTAAAWDLNRRGHEVIVADTSPEAIEIAAAHANARALSLDASDPSAVTQLFGSIDLVVSGLPYRFGASTARAAIEAGIHYLDFGGNPTIVRQQMESDELARERSVTIVPDCGLAPGMANVLATGVIDAFGSSPIDELRIRVGALPAEPTGTLGYQLAFNPVGLINEYAEPCEVLTGGRYATVEPLTGIEELEWEPFGTLEAFHTAGGSSTLPGRFGGRIQELDYKTLRFPGHARPFRAMLEIGLFDEAAQTGSGVAPRTVLLEALERHLPSGGDDLALVRVWGRSSDTVIGYEMVDRTIEPFSALARTTAFPATALAHLILNGHSEPGVRAMDAAMKAGDLIRELADVDIVIDEYGSAA
jgi:lysine 6-dehydrogenase